VVVVVVVVVIVVVAVVVVVVVVVCLSDTLLSHNASSRSDVLTAVISKASVLQRCYALSCWHFESSGGSQYLMVLNPEHKITMLLRNVGNCRHNDTA